MGIDIDSLTQPLPTGAGCGEDLEDSQMLAGLDSLRLFGQIKPLTERERGSDKPLSWREVRSLAEQALSMSKDFRPLTHLGTAVLRLDGPESFIETLEVAATWLDNHWDDVYPRVIDDAVARKSALACFADRMAVLDALRRVPLVTHKVLGSFALRDVELAKGKLKPGAEDTKVPTIEEIDAALQAAPLQDLQFFASLAHRALVAIDRIESTMRTRAPADGPPNLAPLRDFFRATVTLLKAPIERNSPVAADPGAAAEAGGNAASMQDVPDAATPGVIRSRQDAIRCLDAIADFFRREEPSSPVPLFVERTKRLISMDFLQLLDEIVPDAVAQARNAAGVRDSS